MQSVIYDGDLRIARTKYGQFIKGQRQEKDDLIVRELLKIPGFHVATVVARYKGPHASRALRISGKILECRRGTWMAIPECVGYKLRADHDFELAPRGQSVGSLQAKQRRIDEAKRRTAHEKKAPVSHPAVKEEVEEPTKIELKDTTWPKPAIRALTIAGFKYADEVPVGEKELLKIKGIGFKSMKAIRERLTK